MMKIKLLILIGFIGVFFTSCFKEVDTGDIDTQDVTLTYYDTEFAENPSENFQTYKTFVIRDSVGVISDYLTDSQLNEFWSRTGDGPKIRDYIRKKFIAQGYTQVDSIKYADFAVNIVLSLVENTSYVGYPGWWYGWGGYWGWGWSYGYGGYYKSLKSTSDSQYWGGYWGGYYPYYPSWGYTSYSYETGTVMIELIDGKSLTNFYDFMDGKTEDEISDLPPDSIPEIDYRWQAFVNGVVSDYQDYNSDRLERGINESFDQSPYIHAAK